MPRPAQVYTALCTGLMLLSACTTTYTRDRSLAYVEVPIDQSGSLYTLANTDALDDFSATQALTTVYHGRDIKLLVQTEKRGSALNMAAVTPFGMEVFRLSQYGHSLTAHTSNLVDAAFDPSFLLADMQIALLSLEAVNRQLSMGLTATETTIDQDGYVLLRSIQTADAKPVIEVRYTDQSRLKGQIGFHHIQRGYDLTIETLEGGWR